MKYLKIILSLMLVLFLISCGDTTEEPPLELPPVLSVSEFQIELSDVEDLILEVDLKNGTFTNVTGNDITASDYAIDGEELTILADYLSSLTPGEYEFNFVTNYGSVEFTITVIYGVNEPSIIEISSNHFSIKSPQNIVLELAFYDGEFDVLEMNDTVVNQSNYQIDDHELVIKSSFLSTLVVGTKTFTVISTTGEVTFEVVVMDNIIIDTEDVVLDFDDTLTSDLTIDTILHELTNLSITGHSITANDYTINNQSLMIKSSYLNSLSYGLYTFHLTNDDGVDETFRIILDGKPYETFHPNGQLIAKFTNETIVDEALRVQSRFGAIESIEILDSEEITPQQGELITNYESFTFSFVRNNTWWGIIHFTYQATDIYGLVSEPITMEIWYKPLNPTISNDGFKTYQPLGGVEAASNVLFELSNMQGLAFNRVLGHEITPNDYGFSGNTLTIKASYLYTLGYGTYEFEAYTDGGMVLFSIKIFDAVAPGVTPLEFDLEKQDINDMSIALDLKGNTLSKVSLGDETLIENTDYVLDNDTLIINKNYLQTLSYGHHDFTIENVYGGTTLSIHIFDLFNPVLLTTSTTYLSGNDLGLTINLSTFGLELSGISGHGIESSDYIINQSSITLSHLYLNTLDIIDYQFTINTTKDDFTGFVEVTITIVDDPVEPVFSVVTNTYDVILMNQLEYHIEFNDFEFDSIRGYGILSEDYHFTNHTLTISKDFLKYLTDNGWHQFVVTAIRNEIIYEFELEFEVVFDHAINQILNGGFETGDFYGWQTYSIWKDEYFMNAFIEERIVSSGFYGSNGTDPYNKDGVYHLGVYKEPYLNLNKDLNQERMGLLRSSDFMIGGSGFISFKLGGGRNQGAAYISIKETGTNIELARFANRHFGNTTLSNTTNAEAYMFQYYADLSAHLGKSAYIMLTDGASHEWNVLSADSFTTYYEIAPMTTPDTLAVDVKPMISGIETASNAITSKLISNMDLWENPQDIFRWREDRVRSNASTSGGDLAVGVLRSPAFTLNGSNQYLKWEWEGDISKDKQLFVSIKEANTNIEVLRLTRRANLSTKSEGNMDKHWYDLSGLDLSKVYYVEFVDNHRGPWGLISIKNIELLPSNHQDVSVPGDQAVNVYFGHKLASTLDGRHLTNQNDFNYLETSEVTQVVVAPGANLSTGVTIQYQTMKPNTYLEYTLASDLDYETSTVILPSTVEQTLESYSKVYLHTVEIDGLDENENYQFRIHYFDNYTTSYEFNTAPVNGDMNILFITDLQSLNYLQASLNAQIIEQAKLTNPNIFMTIISGDIAEVGSVQSYYDNIFAYRNSFSGMVLAAVPGNHDYYGSDNQPGDSNQYFETYFTHPDNGNNPPMSSSYYFIANDTLFIMLDVIKSDLGISQATWVDQVVQNNPAKYTIVVMHYSPYGAHHTTMSQDMRNAWLPVFDRNNIDLVLSGHDHVYTRTPSLVNNVLVDATDGTVYLSGGTSGHKQYTANPSVTGQYEFYQPNAGQVYTILTINGSSIEISVYTGDGNLLDSVSILPKNKE